MRTWTLVLLVAVATSFAAAQNDQSEADCRARLQRLGAAVRAYGMIHEGKRPARLSELYYEGLVDRLSDFSCPGSGTTIATPSEIDGKTDYTLDPTAAAGDALVRERSPRHHADRVLAALADGTVKPVSVPAAGTTTAAAASPSTARVPPPSEPPPSGPPPAGIPGVTAPPASAGGTPPSPPTATPPPTVVPAGEFGLAQALYRSGRYLEAIPEYDTVLQKAPDNHQARSERAVARLWTNDLRGALADWARLANANQGDLESRKLRAGLEILVGDPQLARREADALVRLAPGDALVRLLHGQASAWTGDPGAAKESFALARKLDPTLPAGVYEQASQFLRAGVFSMAHLQFLSLVWMDPSQSAPYFGLGIAASRLGQRDRAIEALETFLRLDPGNVAAEDARKELQHLRTRR